jgi:phosphoenolpyruvate carboxykinase (ATP)
MGNFSTTEALKALAAGPQVHRNLRVAQLIETALLRGEARLAANGALVATTGSRTGRSPRDKFIVDDATTHESVDWGKVNQPFSSERFEALLERVTHHMRERDLFVEDLYCGADPTYRLPIRVIAEYAWHAVFVHQLFVRPEPNELESTCAGVHGDRRPRIPSRSRPATAPALRPSSSPTSPAVSSSSAAQNTPAK